MIGLRFTDPTHLLAAGVPGQAEVPCVILMIELEQGGVVPEEFPQNEVLIADHRTVQGVLEENVMDQLQRHTACAGREAGGVEGLSEVSFRGAVGGTPPPPQETLSCSRRQRRQTNFLA